MKYTLLIIFCALSLTTSAQFWKKKKPAPVVEEVYPRFPEVDQPVCYTVIAVTDVKLNMPDVVFTPFKKTTFEIEMAEDVVMTEAKHHMRFREYKQASYNFSDLSDLYILQNRFSEAKWYLLQSNEISRSLKDDRHTIANLLTLAAIKINLGEAGLAKTDLQEAYTLANANGFTVDASAIDKRISDLQVNKLNSQKAVLRYAEAVEKSNKHQ